MDYIIYGANRVSKDFLYIFNDLKVVCVVDDEWEGDRFLDYEVHKTKWLTENVSSEQIIICDYDKAGKKEMLEQAGFQYGQDFFLETDFFGQLDDFQLPPDRQLVLWGTGNVSEWVSTRFDHQITFYIDTYKDEGKFFHKDVWKPAKITDWKKYFIVIAVDKNRDIAEYLENMGLQENIDYVHYQKLMGQPSKMLEKTIFDRSYYDLDCRTMLNHLEILHGGETRCCCTTFVKHNLDNMLKNSLSEVWNSNLHKILCLSAENRTYSFCDKQMCPLFVGKKNSNTQTGEEDVRNREYLSMGEYPETLNLGYDASCNLSCVTCRKSLYVAKDGEREMISAISQKIKKEYLAKCRFLILAGDGEVFLSQGYKEVYMDSECNPDYIRLLTNGLLLNRKNWERLMEGKKSKVMLTVSVDAATKETYEKIRRNGNFDVLNSNMEYAADLRRRGELKYFRLNFVVQRENYREMPLFVQWGKDLGADEIFFTKILNWGTYSEEEFERISMMEKDGLTPKRELSEILDLPIMQSDIVDMGTIRYAHKIDDVDVVENYYMWELEKRGGKLFHA